MKTRPAEDRCLLLLSGGLDSTALAALRRPRLCLVVDYGQLSARAEIRAASAVAAALQLTIQTVAVDLRAIGAGLLHGDEPAPESPSPEWWPFRNQLLATVGASIALRENLTHVLLGTVAEDGQRHIDGTAEFYHALDQLVGMQEGAVRIGAPAISKSTTELIVESGLGPDVLGWTFSCHRSDLPCGACPGCHKRSDVLSELGILSYPLNSDHHGT
jgi:7-cyano-7-deazaguanine synthase